MLTTFFFVPLFFQDTTAHLAPVRVDGVHTLPNGNGQGKSRQMLMSQGGSTNSMCQDLQGYWYNPGAEITNLPQHRMSQCLWSGQWQDYDTCPTDTNNPNSRINVRRNCWMSCYNMWGDNCNNWCRCNPSSMTRLGSSGPTVNSPPPPTYVNSGGDPYNENSGGDSNNDFELGMGDADAQNGQALGHSWDPSWWFPGTEGARCIWNPITWNQWCYWGLECRSLLGSSWGQTKCVRVQNPWPVPAPVPVPNWGDNSNVPAPAPVNPIGGRRRSSDSLRRLQDQMN